jgi:hypothetical protein
MSKETLKRYAWSSLISFIAGFGASIFGILSSVDVTTLDLSGISWKLVGSAVVGLIVAGFRGGVKALIEYVKSKIGNIVIE